MSRNISIEATNREEILISVPLECIERALGGEAPGSLAGFWAADHSKAAMMMPRLRIKEAIEETKRLSAGPEEGWWCRGCGRAVKEHDGRHHPLYGPVDGGFAICGPVTKEPRS